jgi:LacI family transcriptional regulator
VTVNGNGHGRTGEEGFRLRKKVTIRDVAAAARVSHQTVSRVINDRPDVADETRQRVWQVIAELDYQPSDIARSLVRKHSLALGVVIAGLEYVGPSRTLNGIVRQAEQMGYTLLLKDLPGFDTNDVQPLLNSLLARQVDGIIWAVPEVGGNRGWLCGQLPRLPVPMIFLTMQPRPELSIVTVDNYTGGRVATEHLLEQGYRHIAHISGPLDWWEARQRKAGWHDALSAAGITVAEHGCEPGNWSSTSGEKAVRNLLDRYPEMEAVFAANDQMALGVLHVACRRGLQVPRDLAVVGFDDIPEAAHYWPPLTTVAQGQQKLGGIAVQELVQIIEARQQNRAVAEPETILLQPELIVRESSIRVHPEGEQRTSLPQSQTGADGMARGEPSVSGSTALIMGAEQTLREGWTGERG